MSESSPSFSLSSWKIFALGFGAGVTTAVGLVAVKQLLQILQERPKREGMCNVMVTHKM